jgi:phosphoenolpyruvate---glycerone phosphotransferase subunit DhaL
MELSPIERRRLLESLARSVIAHAGELTDLDRAIGDADHGINMQRGFEAVLAELDGLAVKPLGDALQALGMTLVMKVGGASGPLYGTLFMAIGKSLGNGSALTYERLLVACEAGVSAVEARGKSHAGQKTMLDVLVPALEALRAGPDRLTERLRERAAAAAQATVPMLATRGRASFLKERSIGTMDPGARSSELMIVAVCDCLEATCRTTTWGS